MLPFYKRHPSCGRHACANGSLLAAFRSTPENRQRRQAGKCSCSQEGNTVRRMGTKSVRGQEVLLSKTRIKKDNRKRSIRYDSNPTGPDNILYRLSLATWLPAQKGSSRRADRTSVPSCPMNLRPENHAACARTGRRGFLTPRENSGQFSCSENQLRRGNSVYKDSQNSARPRAVPPGRCFPKDTNDASLAPGQGGDTRH